MKFVFYILALLSFVNSGYGQSDSLFNKVNLSQKLRLQNIFSEQHDSIFTQFDSTISLLFKSHNICKQLPDTSLYYFSVDKLHNQTEGITLAYTLINHIVITSSRNIIIYSWDDLHGGSYHTYTNYIQYKNSSQECITHQIDTSKLDVEVGYYNIEEVEDYLIVFGYGTYGGGQQHFTIRLFKNEKSGFREYFEGYPKGMSIIINSNRGQNIGLTYNQKKHTISYKEYEFDDNVGFHTDNAKTIRLKFKKGKLIQKKYRGNTSIK